MKRTVTRINLLYVFMAIIILWVGVIIISDRLPRSSSNTVGQSQTETDTLQANGAKALTEPTPENNAIQDTPSQKSQSPKPQASSNAQNNTPEAKPYVSPVCTTDYNIPYKHIFVRGSQGVSGGTEGSLMTCTYSDGRPTETYGHPPRDKIHYMNVSSTDYGAAYNICKDYPGYEDACMQIVWEH